MSKLRTGARTPFFADDIPILHNLTAWNFSPLENSPQVYTTTQRDVYIKNGFLAKNATDTAGTIYCVTWAEFQDHRQRSNRDLVTDTQVLALCAVVGIYITSGGWAETPLVKVFGSQAGSGQPTNVTAINVGTIR